MSRARLICSDILSRLSPITSIEEKAVLCSQDIDNIEKNLNLFNEETIKIDDKNKTEIINKQIGHIYEDSQTVVSMDEWLKDRNITIESISTSGFSIDADQFLNPKDNGKRIIKLYYDTTQYRNDLKNKHVQYLSKYLHMNITNGYFS